MKDFKFEYMMLSRLQDEANAFFGTGNEERDKWDCRYHNVRNIWGLSIKSHIAEMKRLWNKIPQDSKPEWCTWEQIMELENKRKIYEKINNKTIKY